MTGPRETFDNFVNECARGYGDNHVLKTTCPKSVKLLQVPNHPVVLGHRFERRSPRSPPP
eukprot:8528354-Pyramimonas_sp.AAC.1